MSSPAGEPLSGAYEPSQPSTVPVRDCVCVLAVYSIRSLRRLFDKAVFSPTTAAIASLARFSQRAHEEDSGSTHIRVRSQAICCKCVCVCVWLRCLEEKCE